MMFGLPKSTEINKSLPKKAIFDKFKINAADRKLFDEQISRLAIAAEISPQTVNVSADEDVLSVYIIIVTLKTDDCDKRNIVLLSKLIDQRMLFALQYEDTVRFAVYRAGYILVSGSKPLDEWKLNINGLDIRTIWNNIIADIGGINLKVGKSLDETIIANERREKLMKQISTLEKKAMAERQPRRKWERAEEIKRLIAELEEMK